MGLDMYLERAKKAERRKKNKDTQEVMYWRKANQIREWFVRNTGYGENDDCKYHRLTEKQLRKLYDDCKTVLTDHSKAEEIMPTSSGFFFGSTAYDEWYFNDIEETAEQLYHILNDTDFETEDIYYYEWW